MYFAVVLCLTLRISDVQIFDKSIRRIAWLPRMAAFFFNIIHRHTRQRGGRSFIVL